MPRQGYNAERRHRTAPHGSRHAASRAQDYHPYAGDKPSRSQLSDACPARYPDRDRGPPPRAERWAKTGRRSGLLSREKIIGLHAGETTTLALVDDGAEASGYTFDSVLPYLRSCKCRVRGTLVDQFGSRARSHLQRHGCKSGRAPPKHPTLRSKQPRNAGDGSCETTSTESSLLRE